MRIAALCRVVGGLALSALAHAQTPAPLSIADATRPPLVVQAAISPDGRHVIALMNRRYGTGVMLVNTDDFSHRDIIFGKWERDAGYLFARYPRQLGWITSGIFAVNYGAVASSHDLSGKRLADLGTWTLGKAVPGDPQSTAVLAFDDFKHRKLAVFDARNGRSRALSYPMSGDPMDWALDATGRLRMLTLANSEFWNDRTLLSHWYRGPVSDEWVKLDEFNVTEERWQPLAASANADELTVLSREGRDTWAIFRYDPVHKQRGEMLAGDAQVDITYAAGDGSYRRFYKGGMKPVAQWLDARWAALQAAIDEALPGKVNRLSGSDPKGRVLVQSYSDADPGVWYVLDAATMKMRLLLEARPDIDPAQMRPMEAMAYTAPDGLSIPAFLTKPTAGQGPWPLVVMVHGGPFVRDHWGWDADTQLLASRGYAVFQPQFRGSAGFGKAFEQAGFGQWGLAMQDDIAAGVQHLIRTGLADPRRICIYGASYGGYAAVWGLIKTPELYRCGVSFAGVSDIAQLYSDDSDFTKITRETSRLRVGDPEKDRARLDAVSPLKHAARIQAPLLIAHGDDDVRVLIGHSERLMKAMDKAGRPYEWLLLKNEGHGLSTEQSMALFTTRLLDFIDRHIGDKAGQPR